MCSPVHRACDLKCAPDVRTGASPASDSWSDVSPPDEIVALPEHRRIQKAKICCLPRFHISQAAVAMVSVIRAQQLMELASLCHSIVKPTKHSPGRVLGL